MTLRSFVTVTMTGLMALMLLGGCSTKTEVSNWWYDQRWEGGGEG